MTESANTRELPEAWLIKRGSTAEAWMPTLIPQSCKSSFAPLFFSFFGIVPVKQHEHAIADDKPSLFLIDLYKLERQFFAKH